MKRIAAAAAALVASLACPALAGNLADLHVVSRSTGQRLPVYSHAGKLYVAGQPGERYSVQVANRSGRRILAVVSVDGINVVTGETAAPEQTGYVLAPGQSYDILGWRKTTDEVAAFYFTALPDSYAARTDRPGNVGVIGLALFREWTPPRPRPPVLQRPLEGAGASARESADAPARADAPPAAPESQAESYRDADRAASAMARREKLGTGHGEREHSTVSYTDFRRATPYPSETLAIYYDRYENLVARGIVPGVPPIAQPRPFPGSVRFVPDPRS